MQYTALYLPSNIEYEAIEFQLEIDGDYPDTKEGFKQLAKAFTAIVDGFGKKLPFPPEILQNLNNDKQIDRLLEDTEFIQDMTYFLTLGSSNIYFSRQNAEVYRLIGVNTNRCLFETLDHRIIDIVKAEDVRKVYEKGEKRRIYSEKN